MQLHAVQGNTCQQHSADTAVSGRVAFRLSCHVTAPLGGKPSSVHIAAASSLDHWHIGELACRCHPRVTIASCTCTNSPASTSSLLKANGPMLACRAGGPSIAGRPL
eukprot:3542748-Amphidinium_carterae.3